MPVDLSRVFPVTSIKDNVLVGANGDITYGFRAYFPQIYTMDAQQYVQLSKGINDIMQQAQAMQQKMQETQEKLQQAEVTGEAGAGMVSVVMNGRHDVKRVDIDDSLMTEDKEILEDLIAAAVNDAVRKVEANNQDVMSNIAGGMQMPPGFKMPF